MSAFFLEYGALLLIPLCIGVSFGISRVAFRPLLTIRARSGLLWGVLQVAVFGILALGLWVSLVVWLKLLPFPEIR